MSLAFIIGAIIAVSFVPSAEGIYCFRCTSSQPGCGKELSIRLQRLHKCPDINPFGGENFCVKVIEKIHSDIVITRECLRTLRRSEKHREKMPTVQRQNYCQLGRNNDPNNPYDENLTFCFCNDKNACNAAISTKRPTSMLAKFWTVFAAAIIIGVSSFLRH